MSQPDFARMPAPVAVAWKAYHDERPSLRKLLRLVDAYEALLKYCAVIAVQNFYSASLASAFPETDRLIRERILRPSLGHWAELLREVMRCFAQRRSDLLSPELFDFQQKLQREGSIKQAFERLNRLRNEYVGHGATLADEDAAALVQEHEKDLQTLLEQASFLADLPLLFVEAQTGEGEFQVKRLMGSDYQTALSHLLSISPTHPPLSVSHVVIQNPKTNAFLDLHPLLLYTECVETIGGKECRRRKVMYFNELRDDQRRIAFLDYWQGHHSRFRPPNLLPEEFRQHFPKPERQPGKANWFEDFVREWTAYFVGRGKELEAINRFVEESPKKVLVIIGAPGMGKSALLARWADERQAIRHFLREGDVATYEPVQVFKNLSLQLSEKFGIPWKAPDQLDPVAYRAAFDQTLQEAVKKGQVILVIDGLDEGVRAQAKGKAMETVQTLVDWLPEPAFIPEGVRMILSTRPELLEHRSFGAKFGEDKAEHLLLGRMTDEDVRALLYQVRSKYDVLERPEYVQAIVERSEGNPLYLRMLLEDMAEGRIAFGNIEQLPKGVIAYFERILEFIEGEGRTKDMPDVEVVLQAKREAWETLAAQGILKPEQVKEMVERERAALEGRAGVRSVALLALYCLAKEPISVNEAAEMLSADKEEAHRAFEVIRTVLVGDGEGGFAIFHSAFRDYFLNLGEYTSDRLHRHASTIEKVQEKLLDYCSRWQEHKSRYALRHYAEHLLDYAKQLYESGKRDKSQEVMNRLLQTLSDIEFIQARGKTGLLRHHRRECEMIAKQVTNIGSRELLYTLAQAISIESPVLEQLPDLTFQTLLNSIKWVESDWTQSLIERWKSSWESTEGGPFLERLLPPREIPGKSPVVETLANNFSCRALAFSSDGKYLAAAGNSVIVWDVITGETVCELEAPRFINGGFADVAWSADDRYIAAIGSLEGYLAIWDFQKQELRFFRKVHEQGRTVSFCPQALRDRFYDWDLLTCGRDSYALWFIEEGSGEFLKAVIPGYEKIWKLLKLFGTEIACEPPLAGATWGKFKGNQVIVVASESGNMLVLHGMQTPVAQLSLGLAIHHVSSSEEGRFIAIVMDADEPPIPGFRGARLGNDHAFVLLDLESRQEPKGYKMKGHLTKVSLVTAENRLLTCEEDTGLVTLWHILPFAMIGSWQGPSIGLTAVALGKGNRTAISTKLGDVMLLSSESLSRLSDQDITGHVWSMSLSPYGDCIIAARATHWLDARFIGDIARIHLQIREVRSLELFTKRDAPLSVLYLPDGRFITGHMDGSLRLWSSDGSLNSKLILREGSGISSICVSKNGELVGVSCGTWYDCYEFPSTVHLLRVADMSEVFADGAGEKGYGGKPGNIVAFGGKDDEILICSGTPIKIWTKADSGWQLAAEIENDLGVITGIGWSPYVDGFVLSYGKGGGGGLALLRPTETGWRKTILWRGALTLGLGLSECGQYLAFMEELCYFCRLKDNEIMTVLGKHLIPRVSEVWSVVVSSTYRLVAFGDANGDVHVFRFHE